ncbi:MAG TPA: ABC transporter ATP-binding protein [Ktedonobacterales bacterium]|nr:ABC transporter ATP-binding protein [Ktedonobacterales bacterium]
MATTSSSSSAAPVTPAASTTSLAQVEALTKRYGSSRGIDDVTFSIGDGEVFGFLGPNGAGKTTTIRTLMGLLRPTSGRASVGGLDSWTQATEVKRLVGYLPGEFSFDPGLTGAQILTYLANLRGGVDQSYLIGLVERLELDPSKKFREYSRGNKQKVGLAQAFMGKPRLLILDEPTSGLDPLNQQEFYKLVAETRADGRSVFLSSHILPEVEHTCDRVGIIREGRLVKVGGVGELKDLRQRVLEAQFSGPAEAAWFSGLPGVVSVTTDEPNTARVTLTGDMADALRVAVEHGALNVATHEPSLEDIFLRFYEPVSEPVA